MWYFWFEIWDEVIEWFADYILCWIQQIFGTA